MSVVRVLRVLDFGFHSSFVIRRSSLRPLMTSGTFILRSLRFHSRAHLGALLGAAVGSGVLSGALVVGDSVRLTLRDRALERLGRTELALASGDRFFTQSLARRLGSPLGFAAPVTSTQTVSPDAISPRGEPPVTTLLQLPGTATSQDDTARANRVQVFGVEDSFWSFGRSPGRHTGLTNGAVLFNEALATQLHAKTGDTIILRLHKPSALSRDAVITPRDDTSVALRLTVQGVVSGAELGNLNLAAAQAPPLNAFVRLEDLAQAAGVPGRANLLLASSAKKPAETSGARAAEQLQLYSNALKRAFRLEDAELSVQMLTNAPFVELSTRRIFLDKPVRDAALGANRTNAIRILTYLVNQFRAGNRTTPYSMVAAAGPPYTSADMGEDEILVNQWLANDLRIKPGDSVELTYFLADSGSTLIERTNRFRVRAIVPLESLYADRALMPDFPGLAKAESTHDWDAGFPLVHKIRDQDEAYWKQYRGTPKAFITLWAGQKMWANRFGDLTAIRWRVPDGTAATDFQRTIYERLRENLQPAELGLRFEPVRAQALAAASQAQDFGELFLGFSFFLITAALLLMALLFQFGIEQRATETGTLLALGFTPKQARRLLLLEGGALALAGGLIGVLGGIWYARAMLLGLSTIWRDAVQGYALEY